MLPKISYINIENSKHRDFLKKLIADKQLIYQNKYLDTFSQELISFEEYL